LRPPYFKIVFPQASPPAPLLEERGEGDLAGAGEVADEATVVDEPIVEVVPAEETAPVEVLVVE